MRPVGPRCYRASARVLGVCSLSKLVSLALFPVSPEEHVVDKGINEAKSKMAALERELEDTKQRMKEVELALADPSNATLLNSLKGLSREELLEERKQLRDELKQLREKENLLLQLQLKQPGLAGALPRSLSSIRPFNTPVACICFDWRFQSHAPRLMPFRKIPGRNSFLSFSFDFRLSCQYVSSRLQVTKLRAAHHCQRQVSAHRSPCPESRVVLLTKMCPRPQVRGHNLRMQTLLRR